MFQGFCIIKNQENSTEKQVEKLLISFPKGQIQHFYVKTRRAPMLLHSRSKQRTDQRVLVLTLKFLALKKR